MSKRSVLVGLAVGFTTYAILSLSVLVPTQPAPIAYRGHPVATLPPEPVRDQALPGDESVGAAISPAPEPAPVVTTTTAPPPIARPVVRHAAPVAAPVPAPVVTPPAPPIDDRPTAMPTDAAASYNIDHTASYTVDGRWPCGVDHRWTLDRTNLTPEFAAYATEAFAAVEQATGQSFPYAELGQADIVVRFAPRAESGLAEDAWATAHRYGAPESMTSALVVLDTAAPNLKGVVFHEVAHVAGLGHTDDWTQVMAIFPHGDSYGVGDLAGLAAVGCR